MQKFSMMSSTQNWWSFVSTGPTDRASGRLESMSKTRCFREAYTGLPVVRATENQKALNCVVLKYSIPVSEE